MPDNPFDAFDAAPQQAPAQAQTNPFDMFDAAPKQPTKAASPSPDYAKDYSNPYATSQGDPDLSLSDLGQAGRGAVAHVAGLPGNAESLGREFLKKKIWGMSNLGQETILPTTQDAEKWFAPPPDERAKGYRTIGGIVGDVAAPYAYAKAAEALMAAPGVIANAVRPVGEVASSLIPGATARAGEAAENAAAETANTVSEVGPATDRSILGKRMMQDLRPDYDDMYAARERMLSQTAAAHDAAEKATQFKGVYDDPILGEAARAQDQAARTAAFRSVYQHPDFADLRTFEANPLGKAISADTTQYGGVPRLDPYDLPPKAFRSAKSVNDLRQLLSGYGNPQDAVESYAGEYASQSLQPMVQGQDAAAAAKAVNRWATQNRAWLNETPATKAAVQDFAERLQATAQQTAQQAAKLARTQRIARTIAKPIVTGAGLGAGYGLYHGLVE